MSLYKNYHNNESNGGLLWVVICLLAVVIMAIPFAQKVKFLSVPVIRSIELSKDKALHDENLTTLIGPSYPSLLPNHLNIVNNENGSQLYYSFDMNGKLGKAIVKVTALHETKVENTGGWSIQKEIATVHTKTKENYEVLIEDHNIFPYKTIKQKMVTELANDSSSSFLGDIYYFISFLVDGDKTKKKWLEKATALGDPSAMNNLAFLYEKGKGVTQDKEKAIALYKQSADGGDILAMYNLGLINRINQPVNYIAALAWYTKSLDTRPNACSFNDLAIMYGKGQGVQQNTEKAKALFSDAAESLLEEPAYYRRLTKEIGSERVKLNYDEAKDAFVKYQYSKYVDDKTINLEHEYPSEVADIAKKISEKIIGRCWE